MDDSRNSLAAGARGTHRPRHAPRLARSALLMLRLRKNGRAKRNILFKYARWSNFKNAGGYYLTRTRGQDAGGGPADPDLLHKPGLAICDGRPCVAETRNPIPHKGGT